MKKAKKKSCVECGHAVSKGNRHAKFRCPPRPGVYGDVRMAKILKRREAKKQENKVRRGIPVAGTGAGSKESEEKA